MTLDYVLIPIQILTLKGFTLREKILLSLIASFNKKGLRMPNDELAKILDVWPSRVSRILKNLERKRCVKIVKPQSRYRTIYLLQSAKVDELLLTTKRNSKKVLLATLDTPTCYQSSNITKELKNKRAHKTKKPVCDESFQRFWEAYPKKQKRVEAQKTWAKLNPSEELTCRIIKDVERRRDTFDWTKENRRYCPLPSSYINGQRWDDQIESTEPATAPPVRDKDGKTEREKMIERTKAII